MPSTKELLEAARAGQAAAFAELVRRYERAAIITAHSQLGDFHLAQDAAQEAFVIAYRRLDQLRDGASFGPWLLRIARRRALRFGRRRRAEPASIESVDCPTAAAPDWIEPYQEVVRHLGRLPEHERIVAVMRHVDGRSVQEIADATGRPVGTITKQLSRAIERLRKWLVVQHG
jgi:RNA polymerase sigma-70 factor (ECF subfamily)